MAELVNPHLQLRPNFRDPILQPLVALGVTADKTAEQVIEDLERNWDQQHAEAVALWDANHPENVADQANPPNPPAVEHEQPLGPPPQVAPQGDMPAEMEGELGSVGSRTRGSSPAIEPDEDGGVPLLKMGKLVVGKKLDDELLFEPSQKVINDLKKLQYVYLHHFLDTKRKEAFEQRASGVGTAFTITADGSAIQTTPDDDPAYTKSILRDDQLSWADFVAAQTTLVRKMWDCGYSRETVDALGQFFGSLDRLRVHREPFGTKAVQLYAALMRHRWHEEMVKKELFDIRVIDEAHIERIRRKLEDDARRAEFSEWQRTMAASTARMGNLVVNNNRGGQARKRARSPEDSRQPSKAKAMAGLDGSPRRERSFRSVTSTNPMLCNLCLSFHTDVRHCNADTRPDGKPTRCSRNSDGHLVVRSSGRVLCTDFQRYGKCTRSGTKHGHECSGCGDSSHGARDCPLVQKI